jgi:hypothetical protein
MATLEDTVREVVQDMMDKDELFTALDVSNKVKLMQPHARHREVRDVVRSMFANDIEPKGWARTGITVIVSDGTPQSALLYHPLSDTWDLDSKYDQQRRNQISLNPVKTAVTAVAAVQSATVAPSPTPAAPSATVTVSATTSVPMPTARDLWKQLFSTQPSLFPTK